MSNQYVKIVIVEALKSFEKHLSLLVALCIITDIAIGDFIPAFYVIFKALIPFELADQYLAGVVLLGAAPCTLPEVIENIKQNIK